MSRDYPKSIRRQLRELRAQAHENELARELTKLAAKFDEWRAGKIDGWELTDLVHKYHNGPARELYSFYVCDSWNHRIQRFTMSGVYLGQWGTEGDGNGQFFYPRDLAVAPDGTVYVADRDNYRIQRFTASGDFLNAWGSWGAGYNQFNEAVGVVFGADGRFYVADRNNDRVQAFGHGYVAQWRTEYFANRWLTGPYISTYDTVIDFNWGAAAPIAGVPADTFSVRWQRYVRLAAGAYRFSLKVDDGARLRVDNTLLMDYWADPQFIAPTADIDLAAGIHSLRLEYYDVTGVAQVHLSWTQLTTPTPTRTTTPTCTGTPTITSTRTVTSTPSRTSTPTASATPEGAATATPTATPTAACKLYLPVVIWD